MALRITGSVIGEPITSSSSSATGMWLSQEVAALQQDGIWQIAPGFTLTSSAATVNEGASITITLTTTGITNGTAIPYVISGANIFANDSANGVITGNFVIQNNSNTISFAANADLLTEGSEAFTITAGGASTSVTINDTSNAIVNADAQFPYTTLALHGNGTNNSQNNTFLDSSTYTHAITRNGNSTQGTFSPYGGNWSNYFDGTNDYLILPSNAAFGFGTGDFTMECWIFPTSTKTDMRLWEFGGNADNVDISITSTGTINYYNGSTSALSSAGVISFNSWSHIALVRSSGTVTVYVNGTSRVTQATTPNSGARAFYLGGVTSTHFEGYISNMRIVKGTAVYTGAFTPPTAPLTAIAGTSLLTCQDNRLIDDSPNNFTITKNGDVSVQRFSPFSPVITTPTTYSGYFDGTGDYLSFTNTSGQGVNFGTGDFTVEMWYYMTNNTTNTTFHTFIRQDTATNNFDFGYRPGASQLVLGAGNVGEVTASTTLLVNTWYHLAVSRSGTDLKFFVNGVQVGTTTTNSYNYNITGGTVRIGSNNYDSTYTAYGYISNLRAVRNAVYTTTFTPPATPLTAIAGTSLLTCQSPTFIDNSTNAFAITANGDSRPTTVNPFGFTNTASEYSTTTFGGSGYLDGTGDYLSIPANAAFTFGTNDHTIEFYYYLPSTSLTSGYSTQWKYSSASTQQATNDYYFQIGTAGGSNVGLLLGGGGSWGILIQPSVSINAFVGVWTHIAWTRSGNTFRLFFNGVQVGTGTYAGSISAQSNPMLLGQEGAGSYAGGYYSNFRVNNGTALYKANFAPPIAPVTAVANTSVLLNFTNAGIIDNAMMNNLETVGDAKISTTQSKFGGTSMYFDGNGDNLSGLANPSLDMGTGNWTIECWVYISSRTLNYPAIFSNNNGSYSAGAIALTNSNADNGAYVDRFVLAVYDIATPTLVASSTNSLNTWYHLALVRNGTSLVMYRDGISVASTTISTNAVFNWGKLGYCIGGGNWDGAQSYFNGYIDDLRVTKGYARYTSNFTPPTEFDNK
jgi:hypothetical protein